MSTCETQSVDLARNDRVHISWPVDGIGPTDLAQARLETGPWVPLVLAADGETVIGYFAGPDFLVPGVATVVPRTSHVTIQIITATETISFDGGFIRLTG